MKRYVVGDVHGEAKQLEALINRIPLQDNDQLIFVGDYIDRGSDSKAVIDYLVKLNKEFRTIFLKGNHEDFLLASLLPDYKASYHYNNQPFETWIFNGGAETLASYDVIGITAGGVWDLQIPNSHKKFYQDLKIWHEDDDCYYVHAGLQNKIPEQTDAYVLLWHRYSLPGEYTLSKKLYYGHTPHKSGVQIYTNEPYGKMYDVDTGGGKGGSISAICVETEEVWSQEKTP